MGPAVGALIGLSSLDWAVPRGVPTKPRDHERYLRAELGPDVLARIALPTRPARAATPRDPVHARKTGLLRRLARAVAGIL